MPALSSRIARQTTGVAGSLSMRAAMSPGSSGRPVSVFCMTAASMSPPARVPCPAHAPSGGAESSGAGGPASPARSAAIGTIVATGEMDGSAGQRGRSDGPEERQSQHRRREKLHHDELHRLVAFASPTAVGRLNTTRRAAWIFGGAKVRFNIRAWSADGAFKRRRRAPLAAVRPLALNQRRCR